MLLLNGFEELKKKKTLCKCEWVDRDDFRCLWPHLKYGILFKDFSPEIFSPTPWTQTCIKGQVREAVSWCPSLRA